MNVVTKIISEALKAVVDDKVSNKLINELIGVSIDEVSEAGINKIKYFIDGQKSEIARILSRDNMRAMNISENYINYVIAEIKDLLSWIEITDEIFKQCKYESSDLKDFLWSKYIENKSDYIECEVEIKKTMFVLSETLIKLACESESFVEDILIQICNTVDDIKVEMREGFNVLIENQKIHDKK